MDTIVLSGARRQPDKGDGINLSQKQACAPEGQHPFLLAQYEALREEIQRRSGFQHQVLIAALTAAGVLLGIGIQQASPTILLLYPLLALCLAAIWSQHAHQITRLGKYIREKAEATLPGGQEFGWETYEHDHGSSEVRTSQRGLLWLGVGGAFVGTQVASIVLGVVLVSRGKNVSDLDYVLVGFDLLIVALTTWVIVRSWQLLPLGSGQAQ